VTALAPREAYRLWAPVYGAENAVTDLEQGLVATMGPSPAGLRLLDAGCGTGRRLVATGAARATGVDLSPEMLAEGRRNPALAGIELIEGDLRALPLPDRSFDLVWCRLMIGHLAELDRAYAELARVAAPGATVIVTDFHPAAHAAGHRRRFRLADEVLEVTHHPHSIARQLEAARREGLALRARCEAAIGPQVRAYYESAGRLALYHQHRGLPVVLALAFTRDG
jgi:malonyl-CoA O-methyltransferase